jgi:hypothetical protein
MVVDFPAPSRTCLWTGAGISADHPTALPLGDDLTKVIVSQVCGSEVWRNAHQDFRAAGMVSASGRPKSAPRLEWVTEHLFRVVGDAALSGFRAFVGATPNELHEFFAAHLSLGGRHITMNFDRCIEDALGDPGIGGGPLHLHGALSSTGLGDLRTRTLELTRGLRPGDGASVIDALQNSRLLIFLGYSGRDYFDIDPFFRSFARAQPGKLRELEVLWVEHETNAKALKPTDPRCATVVDGRPILQALEQLGASVTYVRGPTRGLLAQAASAWGIAAPALAPARESGPARAEALRRAAAEISVSRADGLRSTGVFWFSMGAGRQIVELDRRLAGSKDPVESEVRAGLADVRQAGLMSVGYYRQAAQLANAVEDPVRRHQGLASAYRLRGSAARALWHLLRALSLCARPESSDPEFAGHCGDVREGYVAWYRSARTSAMGNVVAIARRCVIAPARFFLRRDPWFDPVRVFEQFRDCEPYIVAHPHAVEQVARAWREVPEFRRSGPLPASIISRQTEVGVVFIETDHFLGHLNSERHRLAAAVIDSRRSGHSGCGPTLAELERHRRQATSQADLPGELKAVLLERSAGYSGRPFPHAPLRTVEWNLKVKVLWLLNWAIRRLP